MCFTLWSEHSVLTECALLCDFVLNSLMLKPNLMDVVNVLCIGSFSGGRVRCPWHGACFNVKNGDIEDFPGLDSIPSFEVKPIDLSE